jgi:hypothetical protein
MYVFDRSVAAKIYVEEAVLIPSLCVVAMYTLLCSKQYEYEYEIEFESLLLLLLLLLL